MANGSLISWPGDARGGDKRAFEHLAQCHAPRLGRVLLRITRNPDAAEDAMQDTLFRAWQNISRFQRNSSFLTWLTRIGINEAYRSVQRARAKATLPLDDAVGERIPSWRARPEEVFEAREFLAAVDEALGRLPLDYRQAVVLRDVEGLSTREAAEVLEFAGRVLRRPSCPRADRASREMRTPLDLRIEADVHG